MVAVWLRQKADWPVALLYYRFGALRDCSASGAATKAEQGEFVLSKCMAGNAVFARATFAYQAIGHKDCRADCLKEQDIESHVGDVPKLDAGAWNERGQNNVRRA